MSYEMLDCENSVALLVDHQARHLAQRGAAPPGDGRDGAFPEKIRLTVPATS